MVSKGTKATRRKSIARPSKSMVLRRCIENHLAASKSSFNENPNDNQNTVASFRTRGEESEYLALRWLRSRGYKLVARRFRTPYAEIDLLVRHPISEEWLVAEVKSSLWPDQQALGLSRQQRIRLLRASHWLLDEISSVCGREVNFNMMLLVREESPMRRVGFRFLPIF